MFDIQHIVLRSLRNHSPTKEIRESFTIQGNNVVCTKPHLLNPHEEASSSPNSTEYIDSYIRKDASGTGRQRVKRHKRVSKQSSLEEQLLVVNPPKDFVKKAVQGVSCYFR